jgi:glucose-1-phosphate thymidylyltransferase
MTLEKIGLIPAAGRATRLGWPVAKELWPVQINTTEIVPLIECTMRNMIIADCWHHVFVVRPDKPEIMKHVSTKVPQHVQKSYVCQGHVSPGGKSSGLVDAIDSSYHLIKGKNVLFGMPDTYVMPHECFLPLVNALEFDLVDIAFGLFETTDYSKYGMVDIDLNVPAPHTVKEIIDKSGLDLGLRYMWGILAWSPAFTEFLHTQYTENMFDFATILNRAIKHGLDAKAHIIEDGAYDDLGDMESIIRFTKRNAL